MTKVQVVQMELEKKEKMRNQLKIIATIAKFLVLLVILVGVPLYLWFFHREILQEFSDIESTKEFFEQYRSQAVYVLIGLQVIQIVISIIPGQGIQFVAGLFYGLWAGLLISLAGALIGTVVTYYIAGYLGRDALYMFFGADRIDRMLRRINSKRGMILVFLIYLFPGLPKDLCTYAAGISRMKLSAFLIISMIGRTPAMIGSILIGRQLGEGDYTSVIAIGAAAIVLFIIGAIFHNRLSHLVDMAYSRLFREKK